MKSKFKEGAVKFWEYNHVPFDDEQMHDFNPSLLKYQNYALPKYEMNFENDELLNNDCKTVIKLIKDSWKVESSFKNTLIIVQTD